MTVRYWIKEKKTREKHDTPCIGASRDIVLKEQRHGPYDSQEKALQALTNLIEILLVDGWNRAQSHPTRIQPSRDNHLMRGDDDLWFYLEKEPISGDWFDVIFHPKCTPKQIAGGLRVLADLVETCSDQNEATKRVKNFVDLLKSQQ